MSGPARPGSSLGVLIDGEPMPPTEARELWARFSAYMEENKGDLAGFARQEGFASVHPGMHAGGAVLLVSRTAAQRPYAPVGKGPEGSSHSGSSDHQGSARDPGRGGSGKRKGPKRRR